MENEHLLYISKSKKGLFDSCPYAFKLNYIDGIEQDENPYFVIGIDVHDFIDKFFDVIKIEDNELTHISKLTFHPNVPYKKNVTKFEIERWEAIKQAGKDKSFFFPVVKEKRWMTESPKLIGVVDRVHKCCKADQFAPNHPEFKEGDYVIVENKTGAPSLSKCKGYEEDLLWYKIIMEIKRPELAPIKWGAIYFPYNNFVHHCKLEIENCRQLAQSIKKTREQIKMCLETGLWSAKPSANNCKWCNFKNNCPNYMR